jgi:hypothetical protein
MRRRRSRRSFEEGGGDTARRSRPGLAPGLGKAGTGTSSWRVVCHRDPALYETPERTLPSWAAPAAPAAAFRPPPRRPTSAAAPWSPSHWRLSSRLNPCSSAFGGRNDQRKRQSVSVYLFLSLTQRIQFWAIFRYCGKRRSKLWQATNSVHEFRPALQAKVADQASDAECRFQVGEPKSIAATFRTAF